MKKRYTDQQIAFAFKQAEYGISIDEIIKKMSINEATFYNWKKNIVAWYL
jgi:putative transposase